MGVFVTNLWYTRNPLGLVSSRCKHADAIDFFASSFGSISWSTIHDGERRMNCFIVVFRHGLQHLPHEQTTLHIFHWTFRLKRLPAPRLVDMVKGITSLESISHSLRSWNNLVLVLSCIIVWFVVQLCLPRYREEVMLQPVASGVLGILNDELALGSADLLLTLKTLL